MSTTASGKAIVWDLDGVIIDSGEQHWEAWQRLADETGVAFTYSDFLACFGQRNAEIIPRFWGITDPNRIVELADRKEELFREQLRRDSISALPGAIELMTGLKRTGWRQVLASSTPMANIEVVLDLLHLRELLDAHVSGEQVPHGKPAPDTFLLAARTLGVEPSRCVVIEDAVSGVQAAHAGGMLCIAVTNGRDNPGLLQADWVVSSLIEVTPAGVTDLLDAPSETSGH